MQSKFDLVLGSDVARLRLTNPERHNAFDDGLIADLTSALEAVSQDPKARLLVLEAEGKSFSAGADLDWMKRMAAYGEAENIKDAKALATMLRTLNQLPTPTVARVHGPAFGGGVGLVACCDIVIASSDASFCLSETRLGLIPGAISPYVIEAMGQRAARRYFLTAERFSAETALRLGLIHELVEPNQLDDALSKVISALLSAGPNAVRQAKSLIWAVSGIVEDQMLDETARRIAEIRATPEAQEGMTAFFEKRKPSWTPTR